MRKVWVAFLVDLYTHQHPTYGGGEFEKWANSNLDTLLKLNGGDYMSYNSIKEIYLDVI